jgi:hypothetical protein
LKYIDCDWSAAALKRYIIDFVIETCESTVLKWRESNGKKNSTSNDWLRKR